MCVTRKPFAIMLPSGSREQTGAVASSTQKKGRLCSLPSKFGPSASWSSRYSPLMGSTSGTVLARTCKVLTPCLIFNDPEVDTRSWIAPTQRHRDSDNPPFVKVSRRRASGPTQEENSCDRRAKGGFEDGTSGGKRRTGGKNVIDDEYVSMRQIGAIAIDGERLE
jgi:hypothetical protein